KGDKNKVNVPGVTDNKPATEKEPGKENPTGAPALAAEDNDVEDELDKIKWNERPADNAEREKRLMRGLAAYFGINKTYLSETDAFKLAVQTIRDERAKWLTKKVE